MIQLHADYGQQGLLSTFVNKFSSPQIFRFSFLVQHFPYHLTQFSICYPTYMWPDSTSQILLWWMMMVESWTEKSSLRLSWQYIFSTLVHLSLAINSRSVKRSRNFYMLLHTSEQVQALIGLRTSFVQITKCLTKVSKRQSKILFETWMRFGILIHEGTKYTKIQSAIKNRSSVICFVPTL